MSQDQDNTHWNTIKRETCYLSKKHRLKNKTFCFSTPLGNTMKVTLPLTQFVAVFVIADFMNFQI
jgi:hypothetical protein